MKKAKVSKGIIRHVWPTTKPDGRVVELPPQYRGGISPVTGKEKPIPDCIIDVDDDVQQNWVWNEELQRYAPRIKIPVPKPRSAMVEVFAEKLGIDYDELFAAIKERKASHVKENKAAQKAVITEVTSQLADKIQAGEAISTATVDQVRNEVIANNDGFITETKASDDSRSGKVDL
jgi:hypothetical protein